MAQFEIIAPVAGFTGWSAGVAFADGKATVDSETHRAALAYFRRKKYAVVDVAARDAEDAKATKAEKAAAKKAADEAAAKAAADDTAKKTAGGAQ